MVRGQKRADRQRTKRPPSNARNGTWAFRLTDLQPLFFDDHDEVELRLSRQHKLTVYDAAYLELAKRLGQALATFDGPLAGAASAEGTELVA